MRQKLHLLWHYTSPMDKMVLSSVLFLEIISLGMLIATIIVKNGVIIAFLLSTIAYLGMLIAWLKTALGGAEKQFKYNKHMLLHGAKAQPYDFYKDETKL